MTSFTHPSARAQDITFQHDLFTVHLADGRRVSVPLSWFPRLHHATSEQREAWRLIGNGEGIHWETIDEDISINGLLNPPVDYLAKETMSQYGSEEQADATPVTDLTQLPPAGTINGMSWGEYTQRQYAEPHRIGLYDVGGGAPYCGLIVPAPSGYLIMQQTTGMLCTQRELEGMYVPLPSHELARGLESLDVGCCTDTLDDFEAGEAYRAEHAEEVARNDAWAREHHPELAALWDAMAVRPRSYGLSLEEANQLDELLRQERVPLSVDRERLQRSTEAWVWVRVAGNVANWENQYRDGFHFQWLLAALSGHEAVLTWENCD